MTAPPQKTLPRVVDAQFRAGAAQADQLPASQFVEVAFAGRSNVGKSSLLNALMGRKRLVRTSSTPGCTRQVSLFDVKTRAGSQLCFADLPGYGYAKRSHAERRQWGELIDGYLLSRPTLGMLVALVDIRRGLQPEDAQLLELIAQKPRASRGKVAVVHVATKLDKLPHSARKLELHKLKQQTGLSFLGFSTELPETHERLWRRLLGGLGMEQAPTEASGESNTEAEAGGESDTEATGEA